MGEQWQNSSGPQIALRHLTVATSRLLAGYAYSRWTCGRLVGNLTECRLYSGELSTSERAKDLMWARYSANQRKRYL
jgi:hypothetical protein